MKYLKIILILMIHWRASETQITTGSCTNVNDTLCLKYLSLGIKCSSLTYVNSVPLTQYCCKSCTTSAITPDAANPARRARSTAASV